MYWEHTPTVSCIEAWFYLFIKVCRALQMCVIKVYFLSCFRIMDAKSVYDKKEFFVTVRSIPNPDVSEPVIYLSESDKSEFLFNLILSQRQKNNLIWRQSNLLLCLQLLLNLRKKPKKTLWDRKLYQKKIWIWRNFLSLTSPAWSVTNSGFHQLF